MILFSGIKVLGVLTSVAHRLEAALGILLTDNRHQSSESIANCTQLVLVTPSELFRRANALIKLNREWFDKTLALYPADMRVVALVGGLRSRLSTGCNN